MCDSINTGRTYSVIIETQVSQEHSSRKEKGCWVGLVYSVSSKPIVETGTRKYLILALDIETDVSAAGLKHGDIASHVATGHHTRPANKCGSNVGEDTSVNWTVSEN